MSKTTLAGETVLTLAAPEYPGFDDPKYAPTPDDRVITVLGANDEICAQAGFPNDRSLFQPGRFVTRHAADVDSAGNIYVVEWVTGGRITKLARAR